MNPTNATSEAHLGVLQNYTACDISDALVKLKVTGGGFIPDLQSVSQPEDANSPVTIAPASTVLFVPKGAVLDAPTANLPNDAHWADLTPPGTAVIIKQPDGQKNAVCGGIMAIRMRARQAAAVIVAGRARDVVELRSTGLPIWARGLSTVGAGAASTPWAIQVPLDLDGTIVRPGDLVFCDPVNGIVIIPQDKVEKVVELLPRLTAADDKVKQDVLRGGSVYDAFKAHRSGL